MLYTDSHFLSSYCSGVQGHHGHAIRAVTLLWYQDDFMQFHAVHFLTLFSKMIKQTICLHHLRFLLWFCIFLIFKRNWPCWSCTLLIFLQQHVIRSQGRKPSTYCLNSVKSHCDTMLTTDLHRKTRQSSSNISYCIKRRL